MAQERARHALNQTAGRRVLGEVDRQAPAA
ncbi:MAG: hypothetical protein ACI8WY_002549 [Planctomycetota bacterium]|jgi:hypothetical protein